MVRVRAGRAMGGVVEQVRTDWAPTGNIREGSEVISRRVDSRWS